MPFPLRDPLKDHNTDQLDRGRARWASICQKPHSVSPHGWGLLKSHARYGPAHFSQHLHPKGNFKGHLILMFLVHFPLTHQNQVLKGCFDL